MTRQFIAFLSGCTKAVEAARVHMRDLASAWQVNIVEAQLRALQSAIRYSISLQDAVAKPKIICGLTSQKKSTEKL